MSNVRLRRLQADFTNVRDFVKRHPRLQLVQVEGDPPEKYQLEYRINSLRQTGEDLVEAESHLVEIALPRNYPRTPPHCRMLTPIFHPNIAPHAICIGDHWSAGESLAALVGRIGELIAYQTYNTKSPLNGEAARWVDQNLDRLPLDPVSMIPEDSPATATALEAPVAPARATPVMVTPPPVPRPQKPPPLPNPAPVIVDSALPEIIRFGCFGCGGNFRAPREFIGKRAKCPRCGTVCTITADES